MRAGKALVLNPQWSVFRNQGRRKADFFGHGHLVNGQMWLARIAMLRDGAHGMHRSGIHGSVEDGAYAIVMGLHFKPETYADTDYGPTIFYIGTPLTDRDAGPSNIKDTEEDATDFGHLEPTAASRALMKSHETQRPVRVFRSYNASKLVKNRPKDCYRYDGLYVVKDYICLKAQQQIYRFTMVRLPEDEVGQGPLRGWDDNTADERARKRQERRDRGRGRN
jgi:hypothetical protein